MQVVASVDFSATSAREKLSTWGIDPASDSCQINIDLWLKNRQVRPNGSLVVSKLLTQSPRTWYQ